MECCMNCNKYKATALFRCLTTDCLHGYCFWCLTSKKGDWQNFTCKLFDNACQILINISDIQNVNGNREAIDVDTEDDEALAAALQASIDNSIDTLPVVEIKNDAKDVNDVNEGGDVLIVSGSGKAEIEDSVPSEESNGDGSNVAVNLNDNAWDGESNGNNPDVNIDDINENEVDGDGNAIASEIGNGNDADSKEDIQGQLNKVLAEIDQKL